MYHELIIRWGGGGSRRYFNGALGGISGGYNGPYVLTCGECDSRGVTWVYLFGMIGGVAGVFTIGRWCCVGVAEGCRRGGSRRYLWGWWGPLQRGGHGLIYWDCGGGGVEGGGPGSLCDVRGGGGV